MYERVWEGTERGLDGTEWNLTLDFDMDTGLFQVGGAMDGESPDTYECADPVISGFMAGSKYDLPDSPEMMALIPPAPLKMQGRFAPFSSPDQIVSSTWRTPRDWPEARKKDTTWYMFMRRMRIAASAGHFDSYRMAVQKCSRLLNGMYGDPSKWPRRAVDTVLGYPRGTMPGNKYHDVGLCGLWLPPEFSAAVVRKGSELEGRALGYRDAVHALLKKAKSECLPIDRNWTDWEDCFGVIPSVDATQFVNELSEGNTVSLSLAANFSPDGRNTVELGDVMVDLKSADWYRKRFEEYEFLHGPLNVNNLGKLPLDEFDAYLRNCDSSQLYARWADAFLDGEYGVDLEGDMDRVLISVKVFDEFDARDDHGLKYEGLVRKAVSWSKSEEVYHVETLSSRKYLREGIMSFEQSWKSGDATFDSFPSQFMPDMSTMPMTMDGEPGAFVNARYAFDPDRLLRGYDRKDAQSKTVPGTKALKENLAKLDKKPAVNQSQGKEGRGWHV